MIMAQALAEHTGTPVSHHADGNLSQALEGIRDALRELRYGTVTVIVQDGVVVQVERTEKLRLLKRPRDP